MRALVTTQPGTGHLQTVMPVATALARSGHDVAVCSSSTLRSEVEKRGFTHLAAGPDWHMSWPPQDRPWAGRVSGLGDFTSGIATLWIDVVARAMLPDLLVVARQWEPDLVIRESTEFAGCVAAESLGIAHASVLAGTLTSDQRGSQMIVDALGRLRADAGLPPDPTGQMAYRYLHLCPMPRRFFEGTGESGSASRFVSWPSIGRPSDRLPDWVDDLPDQPTVFVSLGTTAFAARHRHLWDAVIDGLADQPLNLVLGTGSGTDPSSFGPQPPNVHVERFVPQALLLPRCAAMVTSGSLNSIRDSVSQGVPLVLIPFMGAQHTNADRCAALGFARVLGLGEATPDSIGKAVQAVVGDTSHAASARRVAHEMSELPGLNETVSMLETLAGDRRRLLTGQPSTPPTP